MTIERWASPRLAAVWIGSLLLAATARAEDMPRSDLAPSAGKAAVEQVLSLLQSGHYAEARDSARVLVTAAERAAPPDSSALGRALSLLLSAAIRNGEATSPATRALADRAVYVNTRAHGADSDAVAGTLASLASVFNELSSPDSARVALEKALAIREHLFGADDPRVADIVGRLGRTEAQRGNYAAARQLLTRVVGTFERSSDAAPDALPIALNNLGVLLEFTGELRKSRAAYERALRLFEDRLGPEHPTVAAALDNLGNVVTRAGEYDAARPYYERSLRLNERTLGPEHPNVAHVLMNLAVLDDNVGDYEAGLSRSERALALQEKALGVTHADLGYTLTTLGLLRGKLGDPRGAIAALDRAAAIREAAGAGEASNLANTLCERAKVEAALGDSRAAEADYERALALFESVHGREHEFVAGTALAYAKELCHAGSFSKARAILDRALGTLERVHGQEHPLFAEALVENARLLDGEGNRAGAEHALRRALETQERVLGEGHPHLALTLRDLGEVLHATGREAEALDVSLRAETIGREHLHRTMRTLPDRRALEVAALRTSGLDVVLSIAAAEDATQETERRAWDSLVRSRAIVLDEMAQRRAGLGALADPTVARLRASWVESERRLANLYVREIGAGDPTLFRALLDSARAEAEHAESALLAASAIDRATSLRNKAGLEEIVRALPTDAALVAYARYEQRAGDVRAASRAAPRFEYVAFVAMPGAEGVAAMALGPATTIDSLAERWRAAVADARETGGVSGAGRAAGDSLRSLVWDPLPARIGRAKSVFIVPDGALNLIAFGALPLSPIAGGADEPRYLVEAAPTLLFVSAERDLVESREVAASGRGLLAIGDPDFEALAALEERADVPRAHAGLTALETARFRGGRPGCVAFATTRWERLLGTAPEIRETTRRWPKRSGDVVSLTGARASEVAFKSLAPGRSALHVATHGFVIDGGCSQATEGRGFGGLVAEAPPTNAEERPTVKENPLHLSGLVLAGANRRDEAGGDAEDGILTAEEIASLDLHTVECAVISACATGVGAVRAGEGVLGLRRACQVAGVRTLVVSLWSVPDEETRLWMDAFYESKLERGLTTAEAVRTATLERLAAARGGGFDDPTTWGAFVAIE